MALNTHIPGVGSLAGGCSTIDPDTMPGPGDRLKLIQACTAAVAAFKPVLLTRVYRPDKRMIFDQSFDGLHVIGCGHHTGTKTANAPDTSDIAWLWQWHFHPTVGPGMEVTLENFKADGNRFAPGVAAAISGGAQSQWGIVADGGGYSGNPTSIPLKVNLVHMASESHNQSGCVLLGSRAQVVGTDGFKLRYMGLSGFDCSRGMFDFDDVDTSYNAGVGFNPSACTYGRVGRLWTHHNGRSHPSAGVGIGQSVIGEGFKISLEFGALVPHPTHFHVDYALVEDNAGLGFGSTSAGKDGLITGGTIISRRNGRGTCNLTDESNVEVDRLICEDNLFVYAPADVMAGFVINPLDPNSTDMLLFGGIANNNSGRCFFGSVTNARSRGRAIGAGFGSRFNARTVQLIDAAVGYEKINWLGAGATIRIDELTLKGTGGNAGAGAMTGAAIGTTVILP